MDPVTVTLSSPWDLTAEHPDRRGALVAVNVINRMTALGMPASVKAVA